MTSLISRQLGLAGALAAVVILSAGCGTQQSADLFVVKRTGKIPGANLTLLVTDNGTVKCNGGAAKPLPNELLLQARELTKQLAEDQSKPIPMIGVPNSIYDFTVTFGAGKVGWQDGNPYVPESFKQTAYFTRKVAKSVCGLAR
jgi:hypothetical protein